MEPYYRIVCNGASDGCGWATVSSDKGRARSYGEDHALSMRHEVIIQNINDGLVLDGRVRK